MYTRVDIYPTCVYVLKHLKKYKTPYFRAEIAVSLADHLLVPEAQLFPTNSQLKNYFGRGKKTSKGRPKGGEKREKGYYTEIFPLTRSEDPCAFRTSPICTGNHYFLVC